MIESANLPIHTNGQYGKSNDTIVNNNNNYRLKFPFQIKSVDPKTNESLLKDFTGKRIFVFFFFNSIVFIFI